MKRYLKLTSSRTRESWSLQWRHLRRTMRDPAEMAWRLKRVRWADDPAGRTMWNLACDVAYSRAMTGHTLNRLGKVLA